MILLLLAGCGHPLTHAHELAPGSLQSPEVPTATPTLPATVLATPEPPSLSATPDAPRTDTRQPTPVPTPDCLPTFASRPAPAPTPFPDIQEIVDAVHGTGAGQHWANHLTEGSITARGADERLALAGNVGTHNELRWVVVGVADEGWWLRGASPCLGSGFDALPSSIDSPDLLDFDGDGRQEVLSHQLSRQEGWKISSDTLYRWDGSGLASVWEMPTAVQATIADDRLALEPCDVDYRGEWAWVDLDGEGLDEILVREHIVFQDSGEPEAGECGATTDEERAERAFRWDGEAFRPFAPEGPDGLFAYVGSGGVWLWQDHTARPLGVSGAQEIRWSPDGQWVAWWARVSRGDNSPVTVLGLYDVITGARREFLLAGPPSALGWAPDGRLAYALPDQPPILLNPETGQQEPLPVPAPGLWSPEGARMAYERSGSLYVTHLWTGQERPLVLSPEGDGQVTAAVLPDVAWSPQGDWIACRVSTRDATGVALVSSRAAEPVSAPDLTVTSTGCKAAGIQVAWSPDGSRLAVAAAAPSLVQRAGDPCRAEAGCPSSGSSRIVLYLAEVPDGGSAGVGHPIWQKALELETVSQAVGLAWSPDGGRLTFAAGAEVWEVTATGEATLRRRFGFPDPRWDTLEWSPDGSGVLAMLDGAYDQRLYWFPADGGEPVLLLAGDDLGSAHCSPRIVDTQSGPGERPPMVVIERSGYEPRLHFVGAGGADVAVRVRGASPGTLFQVGGQRVYYYMRYVDRRRVLSLPAPDAPGDCQPPLVSPDGVRLAWLCSAGLPDWQALVDGRAEVHYRLVVTDGRGRDPREVSHHVETGPDCRSVRLLRWRSDGAVVYLSRPQIGSAWAHFDYNPGVTAVDVNTGQVTRVGDLEAVHDAQVSSDGAWLVQSLMGERREEGACIMLRSLLGGTERTVACAAGVGATGDFSFSPGDRWLAWREWMKVPGSGRFLIRALRVPQGEPFTVYEDADDEAPQIGGWLGEEQLVLVYPRMADGSGGYSTFLSLPATGPGTLFSPFEFLGVLGEDH